MCCLEPSASQHTNTQSNGHIVEEFQNFTVVLCEVLPCPVVLVAVQRGSAKISRVLPTAGKSLKILSLDHYLRCEKEWSVSLSAGALFM